VGGGRARMGRRAERSTRTRCGAGFFSVCTAFFVAFPSGSCGGGRCASCSVLGLWARWVHVVLPPRAGEISDGERGPCVEKGEKTSETAVFGLVLGGVLGLGCFLGRSRGGNVQQQFSGWVRWESQRDQLSSKTVALSSGRIRIWIWPCGLWLAHVRRRYLTRSKFPCHRLISGCMTWTHKSTLHVLAVGTVVEMLPACLSTFSCSRYGALGLRPMDFVKYFASHLFQFQVTRSV
jgi:hypothetical protein